MTLWCFTQSMSSSVLYLTEFQLQWAKSTHLQDTKFEPKFWSFRRKTSLLLPLSLFSMILPHLMSLHCGVKSLCLCVWPKAIWNYQARTRTAMGFLFMWQRHRANMLILERSRVPLWLQLGRSVISAGHLMKSPENRVENCYLMLRIAEISENILIFDQSFKPTSPLLRRQKQKHVLMWWQVSHAMPCYFSFLDWT